LLGLPQDAPDAGAFDLVVIGGGTAGSCSAAAAAQKGLKVALIQDRPVLGGNASPEILGGVAGLSQGKIDA
jgi:succinate dehydrogenase/fumarate reductase flavoprotein subunit